MIKMKRTGLLVLCLAVIACGGESFDEPLFTGAGGAAGTGGEAGEATTGGVAGTDAGGDAAPDACTAEPCACSDQTGYRLCDGICRQSDGLCCGTPGGWTACCATGCGVDVALVSGYPSYFKNHPACVGVAYCSFHGECSSNCPAPSEADK